MLICDLIIMKCGCACPKTIDFCQQARNSQCLDALTTLLQKEGGFRYTARHFNILSFQSSASSQKPNWRPPTRAIQKVPSGLAIMGAELKR